MSRYRRRCLAARTKSSTVTLQAGGRYPPDTYKPLVSRSIAPNSVPSNIVKVWTSDKNSPYTAGSRAVLNCSQTANPGFVTDYRWQGAFRYSIHAPSAACAVTINYFTKTPRGSVLAQGIIWVSEVSQELE